MKMGIILLIAGVALSVSGVVLMARDRGARSVQSSESRPFITAQHPSPESENSPEAMPTQEPAIVTESEAPKPEKGVCRCRSGRLARLAVGAVCRSPGLYRGKLNNEG